MNGLELQSELAAAGYDIPVVFITAYDNKVSRQQAMQAGAVAFLGKPFRDEELLQTIRSALRREFEATKDLISVVDDDESIRRTTTLLIESFGFRATAFESAESFLKSGQLHDIHVSSLTFGAGHEWIRAPKRVGCRRLRHSYHFHHRLRQ